MKKLISLSLLLFSTILFANVTFKTGVFLQNKLIDTITILYIIIGFIFLIYLIFQLPSTKSLFGITKIVEKNITTNILLLTILYIITLWSLLAFSEYFFLNDANKPLLNFFQLTNNPNRILARFIMICSILLGGILVSLFFARLKYEQQRTIENEENLRTTLNSIGDGVISTDTNGNITNINPIAQTLTGWSKKEAQGKPLKKIFHIINSKTKKIMPNPVKKILASGEIGFLPNHTILISKDKTQYIIEDSAAPILDKNQKITGVILVFRDATKEHEMRKKAKNELIAKDELMISQSRHAAMGEMISMIAHQWRQPLSVISMGANNIIMDIELDEINNKTLKSNAKLITNQTQELSKTINDFRDFFKPKKEIEELPVKNLFKETFKIIEKSLENNNIEVITQFNSNKTIHTYSRELTQVLINILNNAKEALTEDNIKEKKIFISAQSTLNNIHINICDTGGGLKEELIKKIFDPYFSTKNEKNGTGLGLYICKIIVEKHLEGTIKAYNKDAGMCFEINLPFKI